MRFVEIEDKEGNPFDSTDSSLSSDDSSSVSTSVSTDSMDSSLSSDDSSSVSTPVSTDSNLYDSSSDDDSFSVCDRWDDDSSSEWDTDSGVTDSPDSDSDSSDSDEKNYDE